MSFFNKNKQKLSIFMGIIIAGFSFSGIFQLYKSNCCKISLLNNDPAYSLKTVIVFDKILKGVFSSKFQKKLPLTDTSHKKKNNISGFLFILSCILISGEGTALFWLIMTAVGMFIEYARFTRDRNKEILRPPDIKFYEWWSLKFLSPVQKCIQSLIKQYDINPAVIYGAVCAHE